MLDLKEMENFDNSGSKATKEFFLLPENCFKREEKY